MRWIKGRSGQIMCHRQKYAAAAAAAAVLLLLPNFLLRRYVPIVIHWHRATSSSDKCTTCKCPCKVCRLVQQAAAPNRAGNAAILFCNSPLKIQAARKARRARAEKWQVNLQQRLVGEKTLSLRMLRSAGVPTRPVAFSLSKHEKLMRESSLLPEVRTNASRPSVFAFPM